MGWNGESILTSRGKGETNKRRTAVDVGRKLSKRGNPHYGRPTSLGPSSRQVYMDAESSRPTRTEGETDIGQTTVDFRKTPKTRGNLQYDKPTPGGLPIGHMDTDVCQIATYVGRTTKKGGNPQYEDLHRAARHTDVVTTSWEWDRLARGTRARARNGQCWRRR